VDVEFDSSGPEGMYCFRSYENGQKDWDKTRHPNILKSVVVGKKSWGLHVKMWAEGIAEGSFTKKEILQQFYDKDIEIPSSLLIDLDNRIYKKTIKYIQRLNDL